ncbi:hypothetical protein BC830DRAFT_1108413 [Chytriomyces sp. MP71]|nr:hypothetical protein BC830DRAFT_1108413 [Chytriomyces sp. MP71]
MSSNQDGNGSYASVDVSLGNFEAALLFNGIIALVVTVAFFICRPLFPSTYAARLLFVNSKKQPASLGERVFSSALVRAIKASDSVIVSKCGHDAYATIFFVRTMTILFSLIALPSWALLLPINATGGNSLQGLNLLTLGNIADETRLYAHFFMALYATALTLLAIFRIILESVRLRVLHNKNSEGSARVLMVRDVPPEWRNEKELAAIFHRVCPDSVEKVVIPTQVSAEQLKMAKKHVSIRDKLESAIAVYLSKVASHFKQGTDADADFVPRGNPIENQTQLAQLRLTHKEFDMKGTPRTVDSISEYATLFRESQRQMSESQREREAAGSPALSTSFVVFKDAFYPHVAARSIIYNTPWVMGEKFACVHPNDVIWKNANTPYLTRECRAALANLISFAMIIFWGAIVAAVLSVADLANLGKSVPAVQTFLDNNETLANVIGGILPSIVVSVLLSLVPPILAALAVFGGSPLNTVTDNAVFSGYFLFQVIDVFAVNVVGGSILTSFKQIADRPSSVLNILAQSIPQSANFFIQFLLVRGLSAPSMELLQVSRLVTGPIMAWLFGKTPRALFAGRQPPVFVYATAMASHSLTVTIGLTFSILAPIVMFFVVAYLALYTAVYMYMMQYVYNIKTSTGGKFLFTAANQCFVGLFIMEFMTFALFLVNKNIVTAVLMLVAVVLTIWACVKAQQFMSMVETVPACSVANQVTEFTSGVNVTPSWITSLFPGINPDEIVEEDFASLLEDGKKLYADPSFGRDDLKLWIPKCSVGTVFHDLVEEVVADGTVVSDALIVTTGAAVNERGAVVVSEGKYDVMATL